MPGRIPKLALDSALLQRLMTLTPLLIGGVLLMYSAIRGFTTLLTRRGTISDLRQRVLGRSRWAVMAVLGPPRAFRAVAAPTDSPPYENADTWYYPIEQRDRSAMALTFSGNVVDRVEFFRGVEKIP